MGLRELCTGEICPGGERDREEQDRTARTCFVLELHKHHPLVVKDDRLSAATNPEQGCEAAQIPVVGGRTRVGDILHSPGWDPSRSWLLTATGPLQQQRREQRSYKCNCRFTDCFF